MKTMIKLITFAVLLIILLPAIHGDAYSIYVADSEDLSAYIFELQTNPDVSTINDPYHYTNNYAPGLEGTQNAARSQYIQSYTVNGIDYEFETLVQTQGYVNVPVYTTTEELTPERIAGYISVAQLYPGVVILGNPTEDYNCHSYAWYMESTANPYCIFDVELYAYDAHTVWRKNTETPQPGDICVYLRNGIMVHSAVVVSSDGTTTICRSKWGPSVLCEHPIGSVPAEYLDVDKVPRCYVMTITPHEWNYEFVGTNQHTRTCAICGYEQTVNCNLQYTNITNTRHSVICTECGYYVNSQLCSLTYTSRGNKTHTASCSQCKNTFTGNCSITYSYTSSNQHRGSCNKCSYTHTASCYYMTTYCGNSSLGDVHKKQCQTCGHISGSATTACSLIYKSNGNNTHSYQCTQCGHVKSGPTACMFKSDNTCKFCGAMKNSAVINDLEQEETA